MFDFVEILKQYWPLWVALFGSYIFKNWITNFLEGLAVYLGKNFNNGDVVIINGDKARIIRIGVRHTTFHIISRNTWFIVRNDRFKYANIEKVLSNYNTKDIKSH